MIDEFLQAYPANKPRSGINEAFHDELGGQLPRQLHELYDQAGLGKLREGLFELVDPRTISAAYADFLVAMQAAVHHFWLMPSASLSHTSGLDHEKQKSQFYIRTALSWKY